MLTSLVSRGLTSTSVWGQVCVRATYKKSNCVPQDRAGGSTLSQTMLSVTQIHSCLSSTRSLAYTNTAINKISSLMKALMESITQYWKEGQVKKDVIFVQLFFLSFFQKKKKKHLTKSIISYFGVL